MISTQEMRKLEGDSSIPSSVLMERAGKAIAAAMQEKYEVKNKNVLVVAYHGNNGGDGLVAARYLTGIAEVDVLFLGDEESATELVKNSYKRLEEEARVQFLTLETIDFNAYDFILDAILGTGAQGPIRDSIATVIKRMNESKAVKVAVDIPTGIDPDSGKKSEVFFDADLIITIHDIKRGIADLADKTIIADIGLTTQTKQ